MKEAIYLNSKAKNRTLFAMLPCIKLLFEGQFLKKKLDVNHEKTAFII